ncbi:hypothetical protein ACQ4PT_036499 [Festuca glaucescens]
MDSWLRSAALDGLRGNRVRRLLAAGLPPSIFGCSQALCVVTIASCKLLDGVVFQELHFPHLKILSLERVRIPDLSLQLLIDGCPALEFLFAHTTTRFRHVQINAITLTSICVRINDPNTSAEPPQLHSEGLIIETAPPLERLIHLYAIS